MSRRAPAARHWRAGVLERCAGRRLCAAVSNRGHGEPSASESSDRAARDRFHADPPAGPLDPGRIIAFRACGRQGVNDRRGVWRHPLISLDSDGDFLIVDRAGEGANLILQRLAQPLEVTARTNFRYSSEPFLSPAHDLRECYCDHERAPVEQVLDESADAEDRKAGNPLRGNRR